MCSRNATRMHVCGEYIKDACVWQEDSRDAYVLRIHRGCLCVLQKHDRNACMWRTHRGCLCVLQKRNRNACVLRIHRECLCVLQKRSRNACVWRIHRECLCVLQENARLKGVLPTLEAGPEVFHPKDTPYLHSACLGSKKTMLGNIFSTNHFST